MDYYKILGKLEDEVRRYKVEKPTEGWQYNEGQQLLSLCWVEKHVQSVLEIMKKTLERVAASGLVGHQFVTLLSCKLLIYEMSE